jgi:hypothetical protein
MPFPERPGGMANTAARRVACSGTQDLSEFLIENRAVISFVVTYLLTALERAGRIPSSVGDMQEVPVCTSVHSCEPKVTLLYFSSHAAVSMKRIRYRYL